MPCYDPTPPAEYEAHYAKQKVDELTRMLCEVISILRDADLLIHGSKELQDWAKKHDKIDKQRLLKERNATIKKAMDDAEKAWLAGLSPQERKIATGK